MLFDVPASSAPLLSKGQSYRPAPFPARVPKSVVEGTRAENGFTNPEIAQAVAES
jgi:hypothetical protein